MSTQLVSQPFKLLSTVLDLIYVASHSVLYLRFKFLSISLLGKLQIRGSKLPSKSGFQGGPWGYLSYCGGTGVMLWCVSFRFIVVQYETKKNLKFNYAWCGDRCLAPITSVNPSHCICSKLSFYLNNNFKFILHFQMRLHNYC